jgi:hypothetical protein
MHQQKVHVRRIKVLQGIIQRSLNILRVVIAAPQLSRKENAFPWNTALLHASADLSFDVVDTSSVDQPHTESKSSTDGLLLSIGILKGTETYGGDPGSSIQRK